MFKRIREVSIVVEDLDEALADFSSKFGLETASTNFDPRPPVESRSVTFQVGESCIALMESTTPGSPIDRFVKKRGPGLFSFSLEVEDIDEAGEDLRGRGVEFVDDEPMSFPDFPSYDGTYSEAKMLFVKPKSACGTLIEIQQLDR